MNNMENIIPFVISGAFITICFLLTYMEEKINKKKRNKKK